MPPIPRALLRMFLLCLPFAAWLVPLVWALGSNPLSAPFVARSQAELSASLTRQMSRALQPEHLLRRIDAAVAEGDVLRLETLVQLAQDESVQLGDARQRAVAEIRAQHGATDDTTCLQCALDIQVCSTLQQMGTCALPFELSPLGDANALRRNAEAWWSNSEVDRLETALATVGLGATGAALLSGGTAAVMAAPVKLGASVARVARRLGTLQPGLISGLRRLVPEGSPLTSPTALRALRGPLAEMGTVVRNTSFADTVVLLRHADSPEDIARLARVAEAQGPATRATFDVLGKGRVFRTSLRLSDKVIGVLLLAWLCGLQLATLAAGWASRAALRPLVRIGVTRLAT